MGDLTQLKQVDALLDEALDLPTQKQLAFVLKICKEQPEVGNQLKSLLAIKDDSDDFLEGTLSIMADAYEEDTLELSSGDMPRDLINREIGPWRILKEIGHGAWAGSSSRSVPMDAFNGGLPSNSSRPYTTTAVSWNAFTRNAESWANYNIPILLNY